MIVALTEAQLLEIVVDAFTDGVRCAEMIVNSYGISSLSNVYAAFDIIGRSESLPMIISTKGFISGSFHSTFHIKWKCVVLSEGYCPASGQIPDPALPADGKSALMTRNDALSPPTVLSDTCAWSLLSRKCSSPFSGDIFSKPPPRLRSYG